MYVFPVTLGLLAHLLFWGAGLAWLMMPARWRLFWPMLAGGGGIALQSVVVWIGAFANLPGTRSYAWWSELIPAVLLAIAVYRRGLPRLASDVARFGGVLALTLCSATALALPFQMSARGLTTASLGSCDAGDYAAGARVFMDFARHDRGGFLGLTEVTGVMSSDNFYDFWLRLNHFTPSALIALNGTIFDCQPFEITSLLTAVLLATTIPVVFWGARTLMRYRRGPSLLISFLYGFNPLTWYAVYHVAMGQLIAALGIALLTWAGVTLWRYRLEGRRGWVFWGILSIGYVLVLGAYNFIVVVCLIPVIGYAGGMAIWVGAWRRLGRWAVVMMVPLVAASILMAERVAGLAERFSLFQTYDFGWPIPLLGPEGWIGMVNGPLLIRVPGVLHTVLAITVLVALGSAFVRGARKGKNDVFLAVCLTVPALLGYGYLNLRGVLRGTNASYDAYKLFSVFYPGMLAALCFWTTLGRGGRRWQRMVPWFVGVVVVSIELRAAYRFTERMRSPPLVVGRELAQIRSLEGMPNIQSLNMMVPDMWSRLWANSFLLRRAQYFPVHTYEGRRNTALRGDWDLNGGLIYVNLPDGESERLNSDYSIEKTSSPYYLRARLGEGWHDQEHVPRSAARWNWSKGDATLRFENPHTRALRVVCRLDARSMVERDLQLWIGSRRLRTVHVGTDLKVVRVPEISIPPGVSILRLHSSLPPTHLATGDVRPLGFAAYGIEIQVLPEIDEPMFE